MSLAVDGLLLYIAWKLFYILMGIGFIAIVVACFIGLVKHADEIIYKLFRKDN